MANASDKKLQTGLPQTRQPRTSYGQVKQDESFDQTFSKVCGSRAEPSSLVATSETSPTPFFGSFLRLFRQKRTERFFSMLHVLFHYPLFSLTPLAQRKKFAKKKRRDYFAPAGATKGSALGTRRLLKKAGENFHPRELGRLGEGRRKNFQSRQPMLKGAP